MKAICFICTGLDLPGNNVVTARRIQLRPVLNANFSKTAYEVGVLISATEADVGKHVIRTCLIERSGESVTWNVAPLRFSLKAEERQLLMKQALNAKLGPGKYQIDVLLDSDPEPLATLPFSVAAK